MLLTDRTRNEKAPAATANNTEHSQLQNNYKTCVCIYSHILSGGFLLRGRGGCQAKRFAINRYWAACQGI